jgi:hypothetical protein
MAQHQAAPKVGEDILCMSTWLLYMPRRFSAKATSNIYSTQRANSHATIKHAILSNQRSYVDVVVLAGAGVFGNCFVVHLYTTKDKIKTTVCPGNSKYSGAGC